MPELLISMFTVFGVLTIGRILLKQPVVLLSAAGIAGFCGPSLPADALAQMKDIIENPIPVVDVTTCADEDVAECIMEENQRYADQIAVLEDALHALVDGMVPFSSAHAMPDQQDG